MGIRFDSNGELPLKKLEMYDAVIIIRFMFNDINKYYQQVLLDGCLYKTTDNKERKIFIVMNRIEYEIQSKQNTGRNVERRIVQRMPINGIMILRKNLIL